MGIKPISELGTREMGKRWDMEKEAVVDTAHYLNNAIDVINRCHYMHTSVDMAEIEKNLFLAETTLGIWLTQVNEMGGHLYDDINEVEIDEEKELAE